MARTIPTWLNAYTMPIDKRATKQEAPTRLQLLKMTIDGYFEKTPRGHCKIGTGESNPCLWEFMDSDDIGLVVLGTKMATTQGNYTPTKEYTQYIQAIKKCKVDSLGRPSTCASLENVGYPPFMLKLHTGQHLYTFKLAFIDHHYPVGPVKCKTRGAQEDICLCDENGGVYINYATMTLMWQHRVFALCLTKEEKTLDEHSWAFVAQKETKGAEVMKGAQVIDVPYCIIGTDGLEMMHSNYTIP